MLVFKEYKLGEIDHTIQIDSKNANYHACLLMTQQCKRTLDIISRDLDPVVYDHLDYVQAIKNLVLKSRHTKIRIMAFEINSIVRRGHRLLDIASQLSTYIEIRKPAVQFKDYNEGMLVADGTGYVLKMDASRYEAKLNFNDKRQCRILQKEFENMWASAKPDPNLRRMSI